MIKRCDGYDDCEDRSDELACATDFPNSIDENNGNNGDYEPTTRLPYIPPYYPSEFSSTHEVVPKEPESVYTTQRPHILRPEAKSECLFFRQYLNLK